MLHWACEVYLLYGVAISSVCRSVQAMQFHQTSNPFLVYNDARFDQILMDTTAVIGITALMEYFPDMLEQFLIRLFPW
jgi:hypothetical protein